MELKWHGIDVFNRELRYLAVASFKSYKKNYEKIYWKLFHLVET